MPRAAILTPHTGSFAAGYVTGLLASLRAGHLHEVVHLPGGIHMGITRGQVAEQALAGHAEVFLWVDSDIIFTAGDAFAIIDQCTEDHPVVTGVYAQASYDGTLTPLVFGHPPGPGETGGATVMSRSQLDPRLGTIPVAACGFGFVATHRSLIEALAERDGDRLVVRAFYEHWEGDELVGEDIAFCERVAAAGHLLLCDTRVRVRHVKNVDIGI
jgi:hypothetical protein